MKELIDAMVRINFIPMRAVKGLMFEFKIREAKDAAHQDFPAFVDAVRVKFPDYTIFHRGRNWTAYVIPRNVKMSHLSPIRAGHVFEQLHKLDWTPYYVEQRTLRRIIDDLFAGKIIRLTSPYSAYKDQVLEHYNFVYKGLLKFEPSLDYNAISVMLEEQKNEVYFIEE